MDVCRAEKPGFYEMDDGHHVACFLYKDKGS